MPVTELERLIDVDGDDGRAAGLTRSVSRCDADARPWIVRTSLLRPVLVALARSSGSCRLAGSEVVVFELAVVRPIGFLQTGARVGRSGARLMLRVPTIHASSAGASANVLHEYLTGAPGEVPGVWSGGQAAGLGLSGNVGHERCTPLLEGRDPVSGTRLGHALVDRVTADGRVVQAVAGFDATFSAPKSV